MYISFLPGDPVVVSTFKQNTGYNLKNFQLKLGTSDAEIFSGLCEKGKTFQYCLHPPHSV